MKILSRKYAPLAMVLLVLALVLVARSAVFRGSEPFAPVVDDSARVSGQERQPLPLPTRGDAAGEVADSLGRTFNRNGDLVGPVLPPPQPIPVRASKGEVIGYREDASSRVVPIRAGDPGPTPNSAGTYAAVDMWADGGSVLVAPKRTGPSLTEAEFRSRKRRGREASDAAPQR